MSELNLEVKLIATPWLSPSLLNNYYTKEEVGNLKDYVKEVENPLPNTIYGRQEVGNEMKWVTILSTSNLLYYGVSNVNPITSDEVVIFDSTSFPADNNEIEVTINSTTSGYVWFCVTGEVQEVVAIDGMVYKQPLNKQSGTVTITTQTDIRSWTLTLNCYYTPKLIPGTYRFKVTRKEDTPNE